MRNIKKTTDEYVQQWDEDVAKLKAGQTYKQSPAVTISAILQIIDMLNEVLRKQDVKIEEETQTIGTCIKCGLKKKFWTQMFCGEGGDHRE